MICYLDRTFCIRGEGCTCPEWRRYTPEIQAAADRWFGEPGAPVAMGALCIEPATPERAKEGK